MLAKGKRVKSCQMSYHDITTYSMLMVMKWWCQIGTASLGLIHQRPALLELLLDLKKKPTFFLHLSESLGHYRVKCPLFCLYHSKRCWWLNINKDGHWTELPVWLPFRIAVNAILLILLPARSLCEVNTMQALQSPQKGIALESHTSAVWPLAVLGRSVESLWTPSQLQSEKQNRF